MLSLLLLASMLYLMKVFNNSFLELDIGKQLPTRTYRSNKKDEIRRAYIKLGPLYQLYLPCYKNLHIILYFLIFVLHSSNSIFFFINGVFPNGASNDFLHIISDLLKGHIHCYSFNSLVLGDWGLISIDNL